MTSEIELHDSELLQVDADTGTLLIRAYVHREGPGVRREGGTQRILFRFSKFRATGDDQDLSGTIHDGTLLGAGFDPRGLIPLPLEISTPVEMTLVLLPEGLVTTFAGDTLAIEAAGPYEFVEFWRD